MQHAAADALRILGPVAHLYPALADDQGRVLEDGAEAARPWDATGKEVYSQRVSGIGQAYASGACADGKIYYVTDNTTTLVIAAKPKYELIATNKLADTSRANASPVVDNGRLLIRTDKHLYCVGKK
jgi:hypothetical protein